MKKSISVLLIVCLLLTCTVSVFAACSNTQDSIVVLYTNDVHCQLQPVRDVEEGEEPQMGYTNVAAYKKAMLVDTQYVTLVDCGDYVQGDIVGAISKGEYVIDIMNKVGYDFTVLGNHEFDYGMEQLGSLLNKADATTLGCNITYTGNGTNQLSAVKPYEIVTYGKTDVAYIGVSTPHSITSSTPKYFQDENGNFVYGFSNQTAEQFYQCVQSNINRCLEEGADYVVLLTHLGDGTEFAPYASTDLIANTVGVDVVLDGHAHSSIAQKTVANKDGDNVLLSSTGTKLNNIGKLTIAADGTMATTLVEDYAETDSDVDATIAEIQDLYADKINEVVATSNTKLSDSDENGVRMVRNREMAIGNLCADAYREVADADIAFVNGGGIRASLPQGNITLGNLYEVHPYGNMLCLVEATGQEILDALEHSVSKVQKEYVNEKGQSLGESGGFLQVSGIKFEVDTSIASTVQLDNNGMFVGVGGARRVSNVQVLTADGTYEPIDPNKTYTVASHDYMIKNGGDGYTMFMDNNLLLDASMADYQVLMTYLSDVLHGDLSAYSTTEGRITIK